MVIRQPRVSASLTVALSAALAALALGACSFRPWWEPNDQWQSPYLEVNATARQPAAPTLGIVVSVQASGGNYVSLVADGGELRFLSNGALSTAVSALCIPVTATSGPLQLVVQPTGDEALLYANLYSVPPGQNPLVAPDGGMAGACNTTLNPVASQVLPVGATPVTATLDSGTDANVDGSADSGEDASAPGTEGGDATLGEGGSERTDGGSDG